MSKLEAPRTGLADGARRRSDGADGQRARRRCSRRATRSSTAATRTGTTTCAAPPSSTQRGIHYVDVGTSGGVWGLEVGYCMMVGGHEESVAAARADPRRARPARRLAPLRRRRRRPLREDGPQRRRVRDHAGLRRGLRADAQVEVPDRAQGGRRALEPRLGRALVAVRAGRARVRRRGQRPRGAQGPRVGLRRGPLDDRRRDRPRRADAGDHRRRCTPASTRAARATTRTACWPRCATSSAATRSSARRRAERMAVDTTRAGAREPARRGPRAPAGPADDAGHLRRHGRPRAPQAAAGALQPRPRGRAARALQAHRRLAAREGRRRVPRGGARVDREYSRREPDPRGARRAARARAATSPSHFDDPAGYEPLARGARRARRRGGPAARRATTTSRRRRSSSP